MRKKNATALGAWRSTPYPERLSLSIRGSTSPAVTKNRRTPISTRVCSVGGTTGSSAFCWNTDSFFGVVLAVFYSAAKDSLYRRRICTRGSWNHAAASRLCARRPQLPNRLLTIDVDANRQNVCRTFLFARAAPRTILRAPPRAAPRTILRAPPRAAPRTILRAPPRAVRARAVRSRAV